LKPSDLAPILQYGSRTSPHFLAKSVDTQQFLCNTQLFAVFFTALLCHAVCSSSVGSVVDYGADNLGSNLSRFLSTMAVMALEVSVFIFLFKLHF
jgi:Ca2+/H+ antiporter